MVPYPVSATQPGLLAATAVLRVGSALAGPTSSGGSAPAVQQATMDSRTANVSEHCRASQVSSGPQSMMPVHGGTSQMPPFYTLIWG